MQFRGPMVQRVRTRPRERQHPGQNAQPLLSYAFLPPTRATSSDWGTRLSTLPLPTSAPALVSPSAFLFLPCRVGGRFCPICLFLFALLFCFLGLHPKHMEVPGQGWKQSYSWQPQQLGIQATSVAFTTAPGNTGFLTH